MKRSTQITTAQHSLLCNHPYLELLKDEMPPSDYVICINSHAELSNDRLYRSYSVGNISLDEFNEAKSIVNRVHTSYLKKGNIYG